MTPLTIVDSAYSVVIWKYVYCADFRVWIICLFVYTLCWLFLLTWI